MDGRIRFEYAACGRGIFESGKKKLQSQKYPDTCGRGLSWLKSDLFRDLVQMLTQVYLCVRIIYVLSIPYEPSSKLC